MKKTARILSALALVLVTAPDLRAGGVADIDISTIVSADGRSVDLYAANPYDKPVACQRFATTATLTNSTGEFIGFVEFSRGSLTLDPFAEESSNLPPPSAAVALYATYPLARITHLTAPTGECRFDDINKTAGPVVSILPKLCMPAMPSMGFKGRACPFASAATDPIVGPRCSRGDAIDNSDGNGREVTAKRIQWAIDCGYIPAHARQRFENVQDLTTGAWTPRQKWGFPTFAWTDPTHGYTIWKPELSNPTFPDRRTSCNKPEMVVWLTSCEER